VSAAASWHPARRCHRWCWSCGWSGRSRLHRPPATRVCCRRQNPAAGWQPSWCGGGCRPAMLDYRQRRVVSRRSSSCSTWPTRKSNLDCALRLGSQAICLIQQEMMQMTVNLNCLCQCSCHIASIRVRAFQTRHAARGLGKQGLVLLRSRRSGSARGHDHYHDLYRPGFDIDLSASMGRCKMQRISGPLRRLTGCRRLGASNPT
jgi:hypothetical protein